MKLPQCPCGVAAVLVAGLAVSLPVRADVLQSAGAGSALSRVDARADFEHLGALSDNPYIEDGLSFARTALTFDNNGCGYGGCVDTMPATFSGNYLYGTGPGGYFSISAGASLFKGLEFIAGSGYGRDAPINFVWEAYRGAYQTGGGRGSVDSGTVLGFTDSAGFDRLLWSESLTSVDFGSSFNAPAFDTVQAQFTDAVPEAPSYAMLLAGLGLLGMMARRRAAA